MDDANAGRGNADAEELILRTIAAHADSLLRTARRHSLCVDDAQDAYQRGLEIFMRHADRLDPGRAGAWLHTVVKREAKSIRRSRQKLVGSSDVDLDAHEARRLPTPEEQLLSFDMVNRSAEALQRLKPQELRALWLKAQGHSYSEIGAITGWSYTKVNRCLAEGRRSFLERYAGIESGDECERWMPVLCAMVDGEATPEQIAELRPHLRNCPGCRGRLKAMQGSCEPLAAVLPIPFAVIATSPSGESAANIMLRTYEALAGGLHERAVNGVTKAQAAIEAASAGKVAAVAASAAAVAGGGYASVERPVHRELVVDRPSLRAPHSTRPVIHRPSESVAPQPPAAPKQHGSVRRETEFGKPVENRTTRSAPEFAPASKTGGQMVHSDARSTRGTSPLAPSGASSEFSNRPKPATEFSP